MTIEVSIGRERRDRAGLEVAERGTGRPHRHADALHPTEHRRRRRHPQDRLSEHAAHHVCGAGDREQQQRDREAVHQAEHGDRDTPADDGEAQRDSVTRHLAGPAARRARDERARERRRVEQSEHAGVSVEALVDERGEQRDRHPEDHRDEVGDERALQDGAALEVAEPVADRLERHAVAAGDRDGAESRRRARCRSRRSRRRRGRSS